MGTQDERAVLRAVFDRLVPADDWPSLPDAGLFPYLEELRAEPLTRRDAEEIDAGVAALERMAQAEHGQGLSALSPTVVDALIADLDPDHREVLVRAAARAYYGHPEGAGARMIGQPRVPPPVPGAEPALRTTDLGAVDADYDVVVLGAGAGGGVAACVLAEAGARVLLVERGHAEVTGDPDDLRNHRTKAHGLGTRPAEGEPRVVEDGDGTHLVERPWDPESHLGVRIVGGGTRVYQGLAWRFLPDDLRMASRYGVPDGSSLADWPLTYDDLASHYDWVEWEVGVCGDPAGHRAAGHRQRGYPMPPLPEDPEAALLAAGADRLGLATGRVPMLLNSVPRDGRAACGGADCGACVGFPCPTGGRNGTHDTVIPRALASGAVLITGTRAVEITAGPDRVDGVQLVDERTGTARHIRAGHVVVACGAIETARLLLASRSDAHPGGLGNQTDQVGRHLQGHAFASAFGSFDVDLDGPGPGATIATLDLAHGIADDDGRPLVGGGLVGNELRKLAIVHWQWALPPGAPRWGAAGKAAMRDTFRRTGHLFAQVQEVPVPTNRVRLDPDVRDALGMPVARLSGAAHPETVRTARAVVGRAEEWLAASGATRTWVDDVPTGLLAGTHQAGTCRMGTDPATSVTDPDGRVHGFGNLWVADASVHVTNGSVSPALTIMALAHRLATKLAAAASHR
ncbi:MAG TPA: GMC family oxidoreductase [Acidimicrobiales bacterium]|nr:GMC family oxidoreductase [Acidimicrobiales bacterium]